jgi:hypothetical protein
MTQSIIAALPVESRFVPGCLENIIDKKVAKVALNFLEKWVDWILTWIYCPYHNLFMAKLSRVHLFSDAATPLVDSTKQGVANIDFEWRNDYISLHGKKVYFNPIPNVEIVFSRQAYTNYVVVRDDESRRPGWYKIVVQEIPRPENLRPMEKSWRVNTNLLHQFVGWNTPAYLAENPN